MKKFIGLPILVLFVTSYTPSAQDIAFTYDADGNMEYRHVFTLRSGELASEEETSSIKSTELSGQKITLYPNPTQGEICVEISPLIPKEKKWMRLFDSSGRLLEIIQIESERTCFEISGSPGVYLLNIHLGSNCSKWKIIKQ